MPNFIEAVLWITVIFLVIIAMIGAAGIVLFTLAWIIEGIQRLWKN